MPHLQRFVSFHTIKWRFDKKIFFFQRSYVTPLNDKICSFIIWRGKLIKYLVNFNKIFFSAPMLENFPRKNINFLQRSITYRTRQYKPFLLHSSLSSYLMKHRKERKTFNEMHVSSHPHTCELTLWSAVGAYKYLYDFSFMSFYFISSYMNIICLAEACKNEHLLFGINFHYDSIKKI